jgi:hypothetical protein
MLIKQEIRNLVEDTVVREEPITEEDPSNPNPCSGAKGGVPEGVVKYNYLYLTTQRTS